MEKNSIGSVALVDDINLLTLLKLHNYKFYIVSHPMIVINNIFLFFSLLYYRMQEKSYQIWIMIRALGQTHDALEVDVGVIVAKI